mgnify:CR=1 FL=1
MLHHMSRGSEDREIQLLDVTPFNLLRLLGTRNPCQDGKGGEEGHGLLSAQFHVQLALPQRDASRGIWGVTWEYSCGAFEKDLFLVPKKN